MSQFRDAYDEFRRVNAQVATVSVDSPYSHLAWARQLGIRYPMVSDFNRGLLRSYGAVKPGTGYLRRTALRTLFVIDRTRTITFAWYPPPEGGFPPVAAALAAVKRLSSGV